MSIPNNVGLQADPQLAGALAAFQQRMGAWWDERGPQQHLHASMYLRHPVGCHEGGWAEFRFVRPADYQWGLFRTPARDRRIAFGREAGRPVWHKPPQEHAASLLRHIVMQADAEPGSVEQSRALAATAPSLYDLRHLYQFLLEEARHLWAMVHVLLEHFGAEGQSQAEALVSRCCNDAANPRLLNAFNEPNEDWLSYFFWCLLADRDGRFQLDAVASSAFDPLARTAGFMLLEEPLHLAIGVQGIDRVIQRTLELMRQHDTEDVHPHGGIPLATLQRYLNRLAPTVFDLFGNDESDRARQMHECGLRGLPAADAPEGCVTLDRRAGDHVESVEVPLVQGINASMRRSFAAELAPLFARWNRCFADAGTAFRLSLPSERFLRRVGPCAGLAYTPAGERLPSQAGGFDASAWLPTAEECRRVRALMQPVTEPSRCAGWIAPPRLGVNRLPADFTYVRLS